MQTNFTAEQLQDPDLREANAILRRCVHCGLCTATCPTYLTLGDERDSPRGRIYMIKDMLESGRPASSEIRTHVDRCLSCLSCMTTCPSGVDYMHLVDLARTRIEATGRRRLADRLSRRILRSIVPHPGRMRLATLAAPLARPFRGLLRGLGLKAIAAMLDLVPRDLRGRGIGRLARSSAALGERRGRVILLGGCAQQVLRPDINTATIRMLTRLGVEVIVAPEAGCCGALVQHMGFQDEAIRQAARNVQAWQHVMTTEPADAIVITASGCGTTVKDYAHLLNAHPSVQSDAVTVSGLAKDITEYLSRRDPGPPRRWSSLRVAYHSACSMQHGQRVIDEPRRLLERAGFSVVEIPEGHVCCGSAGTYNILQPDISAQLLKRKVANIESTAPDVIATGNIGCITQLQRATDVPVVHTIELIDWAYGGPVPRGLERFEERVQEVPEGRIATLKAAR
ncbi:MAG: glycolate oxidase subunit GlcF [Hyphomicrobiaceae bacterium]